MLFIYFHLLVTSYQYSHNSVYNLGTKIILIFHDLNIKMKAEMQVLELSQVETFPGLTSTNAVFLM